MPLGNYHGNKKATSAWKRQSKVKKVAYDDNWIRATPGGAPATYNSEDGIQPVNPDRMNSWDMGIGKNPMMVRVPKTSTGKK